MESLPRLELDTIGHRFGPSPFLFTNLSYCFEAGRLYALTGPSGSGKTTLLSILAGWTRPSEGSVRRENIATTNVVFQNPLGTAHRTSLDQVALPLLARGYSSVAAKHYAADILKQFQLSDVDDRQFCALSGGEAQRLMLARAVAVAPSLLLIDEPTAQLDQATAATINATIRHVTRSATITIVATHDRHTIAACDQQLDLASLIVGDSQT